MLPFLWKRASFVCCKSNMCFPEARIFWSFSETFFNKKKVSYERQMGDISVREVSSFALALKKFASNFPVCPTVIKSRKFDVATKKIVAYSICWKNLSPNSPVTNGIWPNKQEFQGKDDKGTNGTWRSHARDSQKYEYISVTNYDLLYVVTFISLSFVEEKSKRKFVCRFSESDTYYRKRSSTYESKL